MLLTKEKLLHAEETLKDAIRHTDLIYAPALSDKSEIYLKAENLQTTGSFKLRGAYYKISMLSDEEKAKGVIACSAGNHAQGVALSAKKNGIKATIFIPNTAPISKIEATKKYGAEIRLIDGVYDDAYNASVEYQKETDGIFIHPFDDIDVIAGQGTIGLELLKQLPDIEAVIVPIGGGGLISGIAYAIKTLKPECKVYGVQPEGAASMFNSLHEHHPLTLDNVSTFADGLAVKKTGNLTYQFCEKYVDEVVTVSDDETATALLTLIEQQKLIAEGAGATAVAAVLFNKLPIEGKKTACIVSGGNIDVNILSRVINRGLLSSGRLTSLSIELLDKPGQLRDVIAIIAESGANIIKVSHKQGGRSMGINACFVKISLETRNHKHLEKLISEFKNRGYSNVTENK